MDPASARPPSRKLRWRFLALLLVAAATVAASVYLVASGHARPETIQAIVADAGSLGMVVYVVAVVVAELLWLPRALSLVAAGLLFGPWLGALLSVAGDTLGAVLCFAMARGGGRAWVRDRLTTRPRAAEIIDLLARRQGIVTLIVLRVCPVAHYTFISYATGLVGMPWRTFLIGNTIGLLPCAALYPMLGDAMLRPSSPVFVVSLAFALAMLVLSTFYARRVLRSTAPSKPSDESRDEP